MIKRKHIYLFLFIGFKLTSQEYLPKPEGEIIRHKYYTLSYNEDHEQANWVHYRLNPTFLNGTTPRINSFKVDPNVSTKSAELSDYKGSGYDRGHLAPAGDMKYSKESMIESFFMSNMSPQNPSFNRGIWRKLEEAIRRWGKKIEIYIATAGVLNIKSLGSIGRNKVTIPSKYYKVLYSPEKNSMIGFLLPNIGSSSELKSFIVSVDSIESITGIDFFHELPDEIENKLESEIKLKDWGF
jgi:endonuclease G|tara:strand:- start:113 stop:832 length:720 start_codon:yes stop_codon:yes gene_type:complete